MNDNKPLDQVMARQVGEILIGAIDIADQLILPKWMDSLIRFAGANFRRMNLLDDAYDKTRIKDAYQMETLTQNAARLIWLAHRLGRTVNVYRKTVGLRPIDFYKEAIEIDQREHAKEFESLADPGGTGAPGA